MTYDGNPHTATATATGVGGVNLAGELILSGTTHTDVGTYTGDSWTFTDPTGDYNNASNTITDVINPLGTVSTSTSVATSNGSVVYGSSLTFNGHGHGSQWDVAA